MLRPKLLDWKRSLRDRYNAGLAMVILGELVSVMAFVFFLAVRRSFWELQSIAGLFHWNGIGILGWCIAVGGTFYLSVFFVIKTAWYILDRPCLKSKVCPKMRGEFIRFKKNRDPETGTQTNNFAIVRNLDTGKKVCLTVEEQDDLVPGICYEFLYLPRTKHAYTVGALDEREEDTADTLPASENTAQASYADAEKDTKVKKAKLRKRYFTGLALTIGLDVVAILCLILVWLAEDSFMAIPIAEEGTRFIIWGITLSVALGSASGLTISLVQHIEDWKILKSSSFSTVRGQFVRFKLYWASEWGVLVIRRAFVGCPDANGVEFRLAVSGEKLIPGAYYEFRYLPNTGIAYVSKRYYENGNEQND